MKSNPRMASLYLTPEQKALTNAIVGAYSVPACTLVEKPSPNWRKNLEETGEGSEGYVPETMPKSSDLASLNESCTQHINRGVRGDGGGVDSHSTGEQEEESKE
jgi:hypothetical protein